MAKGLYIGVDGKARKVKKIYTGINGKARKVKKGYIGIDGKARLFFSGEKKLCYYGTATALTTARTDLAAASIGDYAIFFGGANGMSIIDSNMDIYNSSLVKVTNASSGVISELAAASNSSYAIFGGGKNYDRKAQNSVRAINGDLTRTSTSFISSNSARYDLAATTINDYVLFGGGRSSSYILGYVDAFSTDLTRSSLARIIQRYDLAATTVGDYALFGGGYNGKYSNVVDVYQVSESN